jgi:hypothetical protein
VSAAPSAGRLAKLGRFRSALYSAGALLLTVTTGCLVPAGAALAASPAPAPSTQSSGSDVSLAPTLGPGVQTGSDQVALLGQSSWVGPGQTFHLRLQVDAHDPAHEFLSVQQYSLLADRSYFDEALSGHMTGYAQGSPATFKLTSLPGDPAGGVDIDLPVGTSANPDGTQSLEVASQSGVYPIQIGLYSDGNTLQGQLLTTFLIYAQGPESLTQQPPLSVALVVPLHAAPALNANGKSRPLDATTSAQLASQVDTLGGHPGVPVSLAITPQTVDALANGSAVDRATLATLDQLLQTSHDQVLPSAYVDVPYVGWADAGLGSELSAQFAAGASALEKDLSVTPSQTTWVVNGPLDDATLGTLMAEGAKQLIVPDRELSSLPAAATVTTYAWPTQLVGANGLQIPVFGADSGLTADFSNPGGAVLSANHLLAELAMIQSETPHYTRGVAVLPPAGWSGNSTFVATLLAGLQRNPLLRPATASSLFRDVPFSAVPTTAARQVQRSLVVPKAAAATSDTSPVGTTPPSSATSGSGSLSSAATTIPVSTTVPESTTTPSPSAVADQRALAAASRLFGDAGAMQSARSQINGFAAAFPANTQVGEMRQGLLIAESSDVTEAERNGVLGEVGTAVKQKLKLITLPLSSSITLTSTKGQIPLTVLAPPSLHARVELRLTSERLIFRPVSAPGASCQVATPTSEVCDLTLTAENTTLKVPIETRASGVFPLTVSLWTPDNSLQIAHAQDTVHSTAVSGVGVVLIVLAALFLGTWWVRDLRHGRRARRLIPAPGDDAVDDRAETAGLQDAGVASEAVNVDVPEGFDPFVQDFFSTPPPDYEQPRAPRQR